MKNKSFLDIYNLDIVFILLINVKMATIGDILTFICKNCLHFNIYEQDRFYAQLSWA